MTPHIPTELGCSLVARNLTDAISGFLNWKKYLIIDRDVLFHASFRRMLEQAGIRPVQAPPSAPNCNSYLERFNGSFKREAASRVIFFGESYLRRVVNEYLAHFHQERNHQGRSVKIIEPGEEVGLTEGQICRRERLGGMFNYYYRDAA